MTVEDQERRIIAEVRAELEALHAEYHRRHREAVEALLTDAERRLREVRAPRSRGGRRRRSGGGGLPLGCLAAG